MTPKPLRAEPSHFAMTANRVAAGMGWLRRFYPQIALVLAGLILPNILSLLSLLQIVDIGLPPRTGFILFYATLAVCARRLPFAVTAILFLCLLAFDIINTLSLMFGLAPSEFLIAIEHARRIELFTPPLYLALAGGLTLTTLVILALLRQKSVLIRGNIYALLGLAASFAVLDEATNISPHFHFGSAFGRSQPVVSASEMSGFTKAVSTTNRNVMMVVVEGLGYLSDAPTRRRIAAPLYDIAATGAYNLSEGQTVYYGSTTSGEMRELCHTNVFYQDFVISRGATCLPERLHERGYETIAMHGFAQEMFDRKTWYPEVGFQRQLFRDELIALTGRTCGNGGAFPGACDSDFAPVIKAVAKQSRAGEPLFIYWLTLNTHVPVPPGSAKTNFECGSTAHGFGHQTVCQMAELWRDVFAVVATLARDPAIGPAEILIVGDHAPPLWSKKARAQFEPGRVAWYRLTPQDRIAHRP